MKGFSGFKRKTPERLDQCIDVWDLAHLFGTDYNKLSLFLYSKKSKYRVFSVKKKSGDFRFISSPIKALKAIQCKVKSELEMYHRPRKCAHGFVINRSIVTNAKIHTNKSYVLNIDLENFFPSITFGRVKKLFESYPLNLNHSVATVLSHICCHEGCLPQGAPTSPMISNMIAYKLDREFSSLARINNCSYSRYADDITFSFTHNRSHLPSQIVFINLNEKINISRKFIRATSSMIHALLVYGSEKAEKEHFDKYHKGYIPVRQFSRIKENPGDLFIKKIKGRINYIRMIRGTSCSLYRKLMYSFTDALGDPNEEYAKNWLDVISESIFIVDTNLEGHSYQGSAFFLKDIGIVTNQHVIDGIHKGNIDKLSVYEFKKPELPLHFVEFTKSDKELDLGILSPSLHDKLLKPLEANENPDYSNNTKIYIIGYPNHRHGDQPTILEMKIKGPTSYFKQKRIKVDKNIQHGFSGGVVIDTDGKVIGVVANGNEVASRTTNDSAFIPIETLLKYSTVV